MKLAGDHRFEAAGVQDVWDALFDPEVLAAAMPGCEKLELVDGKLVGEMVIQVGPIKGKFTGSVAFEDRDEPRSYKMIVDGKGGPGFVKATATIALEADGTGTRLRYDADAQIGGKLATVGARLVEASAKAIAKQSLDNLGTNIGIRTSHSGTRVPAKPVEPEPVIAPPIEEPIEEPKPAEPTPEPAPIETKPEPAPAPATADVPHVSVKPVYVKADAKTMAKEAAKASFAAMLPYLVVALVAIGVIVWLMKR